MLKIRNRETEIADLHRDVRYIHPAWVHEQCGTSSEPELQDLLDQCSDDKFARRAELGDDAGIFMDMETAKAYFTTVAEREAAAPDFCRANFLDASALVKLHVVEEGAAIIRAYFDREPTSYTTPFCFYEALTLLKVKWLYRKEITKEQYLYAASGLSAWYGAPYRGTLRTSISHCPRRLLTPGESLRGLHWTYQMLFRFLA